MIINKPATTEDIQDLINWLENQTGTYDSENPKNCAIAQYLRDRGYEDVHFFGLHNISADGQSIILPDLIGKIVYGKIVNDMDYGNMPATFAGALTRAHKIHADMIYGIKPSEDPGAALPLVEDGSGIQDGTSTLTEGPAPDLPTDDTN